MPYDLQLPSGRFIRGIPDNIPRNQALIALRGSEQFRGDFPDFKQQEAGILPALKSGLKGTIGAQETGLRGIADLLGISEVEPEAKAGIVRGIGLQQEFAPAVDLEKVKEKFRDPELGVFSAAAEVGRQIPRAVAE